MAARQSEVRFQDPPFGTTITISLPDDVVVPGMDEAALTELAREALLIRLYELGTVSSARAAALLHISRREFLDILGRDRVSIFDDTADLAAEARRG
jgi:predicted HTH domain antitoxin